MADAVGGIRGAAKQRRMAKADAVGGKARLRTVRQGGSNRLQQRYFKQEADW